MINAPSGGAPKKAPRWDLTGTKGCGGGIRFLAPYLVVWGYVGIYRRKKYVGGRPRGPRDRGGSPPISWPPRGSSDVDSKSPGSYSSKNHAAEGFIPFGLRLVFLFFEILK